MAKQSTKSTSTVKKKNIFIAWGEAIALFFELKAVKVTLGALIVAVIVAWMVVINVPFIFIPFAAFMLIYFKKFRAKKFPTYFDLAVLTITLLAGLQSPYAAALARFVGVDPMFVPFLQPGLVVVILVHVLFVDIELSLIYLLFVSMLSAFLYESIALNLFMFNFVTGFVGLIMTSNVRKRFDMLRAGVVLGATQIALYLTMHCCGFDNASYLHIIRAGLVNGISIVGVVMVISWFFEKLFGQVTSISLLELSDFNHPLLRRMVLEAPGSYQHSLVVANLAEAAAEEIGANSLLARVGAYYHDIGKLSKAEYFSENQMLATYRDKHKKLSPSMSTLIIMNHVKEGVELAKKHRLNRRIVDFISQHHGTTLVYYFFAKAQQQQQQQQQQPKKTDEEPKEEVFRYPGPKPQTKEVAIVHLADTIEARSRTLDDPTPARIKDMVRESIIKKFLDGQLDETELTLHDLDQISDVFVRMLSAMFHARVDYQKVTAKSDKNKDDKDNGDTAKQSPEDKKDQ